MFYKVTRGFSDVISHYLNIEDVEKQACLTPFSKRCLLDAGVCVSGDYIYASDFYLRNLKIESVKRYKRNLKINSILQ